MLLPKQNDGISASAIFTDILSMRVTGIILIIFTIRKYDLAVIRNDTTAPTTKMIPKRLI
jgi:hypothetical protein